MQLRWPVAIAYWTWLRDEDEGQLQFTFTFGKVNLPSHQILSRSLLAILILILTQAHYNVKPNNQMLEN